MEGADLSELWADGDLGGEDEDLDALEEPDGGGAASSFWVGEVPSELGDDALRVSLEDIEDGFSLEKYK